MTVRSIARMSARFLLRRRKIAIAECLLLIAASSPLIATARAAQALLAPPKTYDEPERVWLVTSSPDDKPGSSAVTFGSLAKLLGLSQYLEGVTPLQTGESARSLEFDFRAGDLPIRPAGMRVAPSFMTVVGAHVVRGRPFRSDVDDDEVLVSEAFAARYLGGAEHAVGNEITLGAKPRQIVGVTSNLLKPMGEDVEVWLPWRLSAKELASGGLVCCSVIVKPRPGITLTKLNDVLKGLSTTKLKLVVTPLNVFETQLASRLLALIRTISLVLMCLTVLSVAYFHMVEAADRRAEFETLRMLGASLKDITILTMLPAVMIGLLAGLVSVVVSQSLLPLFDVLRPSASTHDKAMPMLGWFAAFLPPILISVVSLLGMSLMNRRFGYRETSYAGRMTARRVVPMRYASAFFLGIAIATTLLVATFALGEARRLNGAGLGFNGADTYGVQINLIGERYQQLPARMTFVQNVLDNLASLVGVQSVAVSTSIPVVGSPTIMVLKEGGRTETEVTRASSGFFQTLHIEPRTGRTLKAGDQNVAVISESFARRVFGTSNPLGQKIDLNVVTEVVGVVPDVVSQVGLVSRPQVYVPFQPGGRLWLLLKTGGSRLAEADVRAAIRRADPDTPIQRFVDVRDQVERGLRPRARVAAATAILSVLTWFIAILGLYGSLGHAVNQRKVDIGTRLALGGPIGMVARQVLWQEWRMIAAGIVASLVSVGLIRRFLSAMLFEVQQIDVAAVIIAVTILIVFSGWCAAYPLRRLAGTPPQVLLTRQS